MKFIESVRKLIPSAIIIAYITLLHFREPQISDALIALGMFTLFGFQAFLRAKEQPDFRKEIRKEISDDMKKLAKEITDTKAEVGKLSMSSTTGAKNGRIHF